MLSTDRPLHPAEVTMRLAFIEARMLANDHDMRMIEEQQHELLDHLRWLRDAGYITQPQLATICADGQCRCVTCSGGQMT